jgi:hypothetical protein
MTTVTVEPSAAESTADAIDRIVGDAKLRSLNPNVRNAWAEVYEPAKAELINLRLDPDLYEQAIKALVDAVGI